MLFPIRGGKYEVVPGLRKMDPDRECFFWITDEFDEQIRAKQRCAVKRSPLHIAPCADREAIDDILLRVGGRYVQEHPERPLTMGARLGMQVQEDLAIVRQEGHGNRVVYLHVSFPNGWNPAEKIGGTFASVHEPVAHFEAMAARQNKIVGAMVDHGPFERFAWGVHTTMALDRLDHSDRWETCLPSQAVFRVERQTTWGFPEYRSALFTIHTMRSRLHELRVGQRLQLADALESMDEKARQYKGASEKTVERLCRFLRGPARHPDLESFRPE